MHSLGPGGKQLRDVMELRHKWDGSQMRPCYQRQHASVSWRTVYQPKKTSALLGVETVSNKGGITVNSGQYYGAYVLLSNKPENLAEQVHRVLPNSFNESAFEFGAFRHVLNNFFRFRNDAVASADDILAHDAWDISGPLIVLHIRKSIPGRRHPNADGALWS